MRSKLLARPAFWFDKSTTVTETIPFAVTPGRHYEVDEFVIRFRPPGRPFLRHPSFQIPPFLCQPHATNPHRWPIPVQLFRIASPDLLFAPIRHLELYVFRFLRTHPGGSLLSAYPRRCRLSATHLWISSVYSAVLITLSHATSLSHPPSRISILFSFDRPALSQIGRFSPSIRFETAIPYSVILLSHLLPAPILTVSRVSCPVSHF